MVGFNLLDDKEAMAKLRQSSLAVTFGVLGNIIAVMVFLAPLPTFRRIYRKKLTEGFQCVPYVFALLSAMLWLYYAALKKDFALLSINVVGCVVEIVYIVMFLIYSPKKSKAHTAMLVVFTNIGMFGIILVSTLTFSKGNQRLQILGGICVAFTISVFASPLCIMRLVIKTKSVEFMPIYLSSFLTANAAVWLCYGLFTHDPWVAGPNILGFILGFIHIVLYVCYWKPTVETTIEKTSRDPESTLSDSPNHPREKDAPKNVVVLPMILDVISLSPQVCEGLKWDIICSFGIRCLVFPTLPINGHKYNDVLLIIILSTLAYFPLPKNMMSIAFSSSSVAIFKFSLACLLSLFTWIMALNIYL